MRASLLSATGILVLAVAAPIDAIAATTITTRTSPTAGVNAGQVRASPAVPAGRAGGAGAPATTPTTTYVPSGGTPPAATTPAMGATGGTPTPTAPATTPSQALLNKRFGKASKATVHQKRGISTLAIVIAALAALVALACAAWAVARQRAYEPHWWLSLRHATAEAGFRTSATWAEFTDWARLGR